MADEIQYYTILTAGGRAKLAAAQASNEPIILTQIALGDGNGQLYDPDENQVALVHQVHRGDISSRRTDPNNPNWVILELRVPTDIGGWFVREVGLFDEDGTLIAIGKYPETYKPQLSSGSAKELLVRMIIEVTSAATVQISIDGSVVWATQEFAAEAGSQAAGAAVTELSSKVSTFALPGFQNLHTLNRRA